MNYDAEAKHVANYVHRQVVERHRGVMPLSEPGTAAVFGNDGYRQSRTTREEVRLLLLDAFERNVTVLGFAVDDLDSSCWAVVVRCDDLDWLKARLHDAYFAAHRLYDGARAPLRQDQRPMVPR